MSISSPILLPENELHIWRYKIKKEHYLNELANPILSKEEKERCAEFVYEKDKLKYMCNHVFRRMVLAKYINVLSADIKYSYTAYGKPYLNQSDIQFSHSYRTDYGLLAIYKGAEVGIDIEQRKKMQDVKTFANFSFSEAEKKLIFADNTFSEDNFFTFWTFKEAFIKAIGIGLNTDITKFDLADYLVPEKTKLSAYKKEGWILKKISAPAGFEAAYAVKGELNKVVEFNF